MLSYLMCASLLAQLPATKVYLTKFTVGPTPPELIALDIPDTTWTVLSLKLEDGTSAQLAINGDVSPRGKTTAQFATEVALLGPRPRVTRTRVDRDTRLAQEGGVKLVAGAQGDAPGWMTLPVSPLGALSLSFDPAEAGLRQVLPPPAPIGGEPPPRSTLRFTSWKRILAMSSADGTPRLAMNGQVLIERDGTVFVTVPLAGGRETKVAGFKAPVVPTCSSLAPPLCVFVERGRARPPVPHHQLAKKVTAPLGALLGDRDRPGTCFQLSPDGRLLAEDAFDPEVETARLLVMDRQTKRTVWTQPQGAGGIDCTWVGSALVSTNSDDQSVTTWDVAGKKLDAVAEWKSPGGWSASLAPGGVRVSPPAGSGSPFTVKAFVIPSDVRWLKDGVLFVGLNSVVDGSARAARSLFTFGTTQQVPTDEPGVLVVSRAEGVYVVHVE